MRDRQHVRQVVVNNLWHRALIARKLATAGADAQPASPSTVRYVWPTRDARDVDSTFNLPADASGGIYAPWVAPAPASSQGFARPITSGQEFAPFVRYGAAAPGQLRLRRQLPAMQPVLAGGSSGASSPSLSDSGPQTAPGSASLPRLPLNFEVPRYGSLSRGGFAVGQPFSLVEGTVPGASGKKEDADERSHADYRQQVLGVGAAETERGPALFPNSRPPRRTARGRGRHRAVASSGLGQGVGREDTGPGRSGGVPEEGARSGGREDEAELVFVSPQLSVAGSRDEALLSSGDDAPLSADTVDVDDIYSYTSS